MGDTAGAETQLKQVASSWDKSMAGLAKLALASLYADTNQTSKAIETYKDLIDHPSKSIGKWTPQFELADLYQSKQPAGGRAQTVPGIAEGEPHLANRSGCHAASAGARGGSRSTSHRTAKPAVARNLSNVRPVA